MREQIPDLNRSLFPYNRKLEREWKMSLPLLSSRRFGKAGERIGIYSDEFW